MGIGTIAIPIFVSVLPKGVTLTIDSITKDAPSGFRAEMSLPNGVSFPHTFTSQDVEDGRPSNERGAKVASLSLWTDGWGLHGGQGGSFLVKFTIKGRPEDHPEADEQNTSGQLTIGTSEWGVFSRPDQTNFVWTIGDKSATFTAKTPMLTYLDDSCIAVEYVPDKKAWVFGVTNQQDFIVKLMQGAVGGIIAGHKALWGVGAGMVASIGGVAVTVVAFGANYVDGL